jgi:hypothetical protein
VVVGASTIATTAPSGRLPDCRRLAFPPWLLGGGRIIRTAEQKIRAGAEDLGQAPQAAERHILNSTRFPPTNVVLGLAQEPGEIHLPQMALHPSMPEPRPENVFPWGLCHSPTSFHPLQVYTGVIFLSTKKNFPVAIDIHWLYTFLCE